MPKSPNASRNTRHASETVALCSVRCSPFLKLHYSSISRCGREREGHSMNRVSLHLRRTSEMCLWCNVLRWKIHIINSRTCYVFCRKLWNACFCANEIVCQPHTRVMQPARFARNSAPNIIRNRFTGKAKTLWTSNIWWEIYYTHMYLYISESLLRIGIDLSCTACDPSCWWSERCLLSFPFCRRRPHSDRIKMKLNVVKQRRKIPIDFRSNR